MVPTMSQFSGRNLRIAVALIFLAGLICRLVVFQGDHQEPDELIYKALVEQINAGRGYTLIGHEIMTQGDIVREQYHSSLFGHPPGGVGLFWLFHRMFGEVGYPLVQIVCYILFFWSMMILGSIVIPASTRPVILLAGLSAFSPIMTHVVSRFWLDGPLLAFSTLATTLFLLAAVRGNTGLACLAGIIFGYSSLIKLTAVLIAPGILLLAWATAESQSRPTLWRLSFWFVGVAALVQAPWELWQWKILGTPFSGPSIPTPALLEADEYTFFITIKRQPLAYLTLVPQVLWTMIPSLFFLELYWTRTASRLKGAALLAWIVMVVAVHVALGYAGFGKILRYVILITPASILLFVLLISEVRSEWQDAGGWSKIRWTTRLILILSAAAVCLEISQGIKTPLVDSDDLIIPFWWKIWNLPWS